MSTSIPIVSIMKIVTTNIMTTIIATTTIMSLLA